MTTEGPFVSEIKKMRGVKVIAFEYGRRGNRDISNIVRMFGLTRDLISFACMLLRFKPDIVHLNSSHSRNGLLRDVAYVAICRLVRARLFIKYHGSEAHFLERPWRTLGRFCVNGASGVGVLSSEEKRNFEKAGYPPEKVWQVKNAVDGLKFGGSVPATKGGVQLLVISRFIPTKGLIESVEAMSMITTKFPHVSLACVGDGPDRSRAERRVKELGLEDRVHFTGRISEEEATQFYISSSMLVFPTYAEEGFPMTLFQAVAAGLPILTTRIRAAADYLEEPLNCLWVKQRSAEDLAAKILILLENPALMRDMATNNRKLAKQFLPTLVAPEYYQIYETICNRETSPISHGQ